MPPHISVIILTCNQCRDTITCLETLDPVPGDMEILLIDNGSTDNTITEVSRRFPDVHIIPLGKNAGVSAGRNAGISHSSGDYIMLLDNDTEPTPEAIRSLAGYLDRHPGCALVAPRLVGRDGLTQRSFRPFPGLSEKIRSLLRITSDTVPSGEIPARPFSPFYLIGAAQLIRSEVFRRIGLFDTLIFYGPEDADLCMRISRSGIGSVIYLPDVVVRHNWRHASRATFSPLWWRHLHSLLHFYIIHRRFL